MTRRSNAVRSLVIVAAVIVVSAVLADVGKRGPVREPRRPDVAAPPTRLLPSADPGPLGPTETTLADPAPPLVVAGEEPAMDADGTRSVSVRDYGAKGDGRTDDSAAIQRANDAMAATGGVVTFPPGTYRASGIRQDSHVEFRGRRGATIRHRDNTSNEQIIRSRVTATSGTIAAGSDRLVVADPRGFVKGALVAVRGAGGPSDTQRSPLSFAIGRGAGSMRIAQGFGFSTGSTFRPNYLFVGDEIVSYWTMSGGQFLGVRRGLFGTEARSHPRGTTVAQANVLYARVTSVSTKQVKLSEVARAGVSDAAAFVGSVGMTIRGLTLDGARTSEGTKGNPFPILYSLAYGAAVADNRIINADDGGIRFDGGTRASTISGNTIMDSGQLSADIGAAVWLFRGSSRNTVRDNRIGGLSFSGIEIDDRTTASTEWDRDATRNTIVNNTIDIPRRGANDGIGIHGSSLNEVTGNVIRGTTFGVRVYTGGQCEPPPPTSRNLVVDNVLEGHEIGIWVDGRANRFSGNVQRDTARPVQDEGADNSFA